MLQALIACAGTCVYLSIMSSSPKRLKMLAALWPATFVRSCAHLLWTPPPANTKSPMERVKVGRSADDHGSCEENAVILLSLGGLDAEEGRGELRATSNDSPWEYVRYRASVVRLRRCSGTMIGA